MVLIFHPPPPPYPLQHWFLFCPFFLVIILAKFPVRYILFSRFRFLHVPTDLMNFLSENQIGLTSEPARNECFPSLSRAPARAAACICICRGGHHQCDSSTLVSCRRFPLDDFSLIWKRQIDMGRVIKNAAACSRYRRYTHPPELYHLPVAWFSAGNVDSQLCASRLDNKIEKKKRKKNRSSGAFSCFAIFYLQL